MLSKSHSGMSDSNHTESVSLDCIVQKPKVKKNKQKTWNLKMFCYKECSFGLRSIIKTAARDMSLYVS